MFAIKSSGTMTDGEIHMWQGSRARLRALEALAFWLIWLISQSEPIQSSFVGVVGIVIVVAASVDTEPEFNLCTFCSLFSKVMRGISYYKLNNKLI